MIACIFIVFVFAQTGNCRAMTSQAKEDVVRILHAKQAYHLAIKNRKNPDFIILDIRTAREYKAGHIQGAYNIDYYSQTFDADIDRLDKKKTYLIYCRTGRRTSIAIRQMLQRGFENLYVSRGDIAAWQAAGLPLVKEIPGK